MARRARTARTSPTDPAASKHAVIYCRVSTEDQAREGVSLDAQQDRLRAYCTVQGLEVVDVIVEAGISGSKRLETRPGGAALLAHVNEGRAGHVVALKLDRLFRNSVDALGVTETWDRAGVALHLLDMGGQSMNTASALGRMFLTMTAGFAEMERKLISERTVAALAHKKGRGEAVSRAPRGCRIEDKRVVVDPSSNGLDLYRRALELREAGLGYQAVADALTAEGFRPERGQQLRASTIHYMLNNARLATLAA